MTDAKTKLQEFFEGLQALADSSFPKKCSQCGKVFNTVDDFVGETEEVRSDTSGLKESWDDDDTPIVELFRNCSCGSTLMDFFTDRRDLSENGLKRREKFGEMMDMVVKAGMDADVARAELLKIMRGDHSKILENFDFDAVNLDA